MEAADLTQAVAKITAIETRTDKTLADHASLKQIVEDLVKRVAALEAQKTEAKVAPAPAPVPTPTPTPAPAPVAAKAPEVAPIKP